MTILDVPRQAPRLAPSQEMASLVMPGELSLSGGELFALYNEQRFAVSALGRVDGRALDGVREQVGSFIRTSEMPVGSSEDRIEHIARFLWQTHGDLVRLSEYDASETFLRAVRQTELEAAAGQAPRIPALKGRLEAILPIMRYVPSEFHAQVLSGLPEYVTSLIGQNQEVTNEVARSGFWRGLLDKILRRDRKNVESAPAIGEQAMTSVIEASPSYPPEQINTDHSLRIAHATTPPSAETELLLKEFMDIRLEFVRAMGWLPDAVSDEDRYDHDPRTAYVLRSNNCNPSEFYAGMRLTSVGSVAESMTWHMMDAAPDMQGNAADNIEAMSRLKEAAWRGELWDLTRLVPALDSRLLEERHLLRNSILDLMGAGVRLTMSSGNEDPAWLFLTTPKMRQYLTQIGITTSTIAIGKVSPTDTEESHLCVAYPRTALELVGGSPKKRDQETYNRVNSASASFNA